LGGSIRELPVTRMGRKCNKLWRYRRRDGWKWLFLHCVDDGVGSNEWLGRPSMGDGQTYAVENLQAKRVRVR